jgi:hypothetical protein
MAVGERSVFNMSTPEQLAAEETSRWCAELGLRRQQRIAQMRIAAAAAALNDKAVPVIEEPPTDEDAAASSSKKRKVEGDELVSPPKFAIGDAVKLPSTSVFAKCTAKIVGTRVQYLVCVPLGGSRSAEMYVDAADLTMPNHKHTQQPGSVV